LTEILLPVTAGFLLLSSLFSALAVYSLRDFSRSRLEKICRFKGRKDRFGVILKQHADALLATELLSTFLMVLFVALVFAGMSPWQPMAADAIDGPTTQVSESAWSVLDGTTLVATIVFVAKVVLVGLLLVLVAVVIPWTVARVAGEKFLYHIWPMLSGLLAVAQPVVSLFYKVDKFAHRLCGLQEPHNGGVSTLTEEIRTVVDEGQREGVIESEARTMIHRVMELQEEDVVAVMTPRTDMHCIQADSTLEEARKQLLEVGHSRIPVIGETTDDIVGILYAKDLLKHMDAENGQTVQLSQIVREPFYVPETTGIDKLLETMKHKRVHLAIVIDEYSGVAGLVTMEDILEEIVGDIVDEYDSAEEAGIHPIGPGLTEVAARVHIDDLNEQFGYNLPEDGDFDTIGGFVFNQLGRVPEASESFNWKQLRITVLAADKRKIHRLQIEVDQSLAAAAAEET
jgi:CBS domain containing-hemolysin-like protein